LDLNGYYIQSRPPYVVKAKILIGLVLIGVAFLTVALGRAMDDEETSERWLNGIAGASVALAAIGAYLMRMA
jgi:hypothetical protein